MEAQFMQWASLGVGGILAGMMFWFYRQDRLDSRTKWQELVARLQTQSAELTERLNHQATERHEQMVEMNRGRIESDTETRTVLRELTAMLRERRG